MDGICRNMSLSAMSCGAAALCQLDETHQRNSLHRAVHFQRVMVKDYCSHSV